jgi:hypothetical protein
MDQNRSKVRLFCWHVQCILQYFAVWYSMILWQFVPQWLKGFISARLQVEPGELLRVAVNTGFGHCSSTCHHSRTELCRVVPRSCPHLLDFGHTSLGHWDPLTQALPFFHHALPKERKNQLWKVKNATCLIEQCWQWLKWALLPKLNQLRIISIHWNLLVLGLLTHATLSFFDRLLRKHKVRLLTICSCALYRYAWSPIRIHGKNRCGLTRFDKFVTLCLWVHISVHCERWISKTCLTMFRPSCSRFSRSFSRPSRLGSVLLASGGWTGSFQKAKTEAQILERSSMEFRGSVSVSSSAQAMSWTSQQCALWSPALQLFRSGHHLRLP